MSYPGLAPIAAQTACLAPRHRPGAAAMRRSSSTPSSIAASEASAGPTALCAAVTHPETARDPSAWRESGPILPSAYDSRIEPSISPGGGDRSRRRKGGLPSLLPRTMVRCAVRAPASGSRHESPNWVGRGGHVERASGRRSRAQHPAGVRDPGPGRGRLQQLSAGPSNGRLRRERSVGPSVPVRRNPTHPAYPT